MSNEIEIELLQDKLHDAVDAFLNDRQSIEAYQKFVHACQELWLAKIHKDIPAAALEITRFRAIVVLMNALIDELEQTINSLTSAITIKVAENGIAAEECKNAVDASGDSRSS